MAEAREFESLYALSYQMRKRFLEIFTRLGFGHVTTAFSATEILLTLYKEVLCYQAENPNWGGRDRFVLSKGHGAGMLFPIFEEIGYLSPEQTDDMIRIGGYYEYIRSLFLPGYDFYGGSLGHGVGIAAGLALGARLNREDWYTYCLVGDAECCEGSVWEAAMFAGHQGLSNLVAIVDRNALGCSDFTERMLRMEPFAEKWSACHWDVQEVDGHTYEELVPVLKASHSPRRSRPRCIIANTIKGKGLEYLYDKPLMHGYMPNKPEDVEKAFRELQKY